MADNFKAMANYVKASIEEEKTALSSAIERIQKQHKGKVIYKDDDSIMFLLKDTDIAKTIH
jgi:hypothetical protein